nr:hypothetical protein K4M19_00122 [Agrobacterium fabrum]
MRRGIDGLSALVETVVKGGAGLGRDFRLPRKARRPDQASLVGRPGVLPVLQDFGAWILSLADSERRCRAPDAGAAFHAG